MCSTAVSCCTMKTSLLASMSCSRCAVQGVHLPLTLLQERLEGKAMDFADEKAREAQSEIMKMEVGSRVMHVPTCRLSIRLKTQRRYAAACTALLGAVAESR